MALVDKIEPLTPQPYWNRSRPKDTFITDRGFDETPARMTMKEYDEEKLSGDPFVGPPFPSKPGNPADGQAVTCLSRAAMACLFEIHFPEGGIDRADAIHAFDRIDQIEEKLTVYRDTSEISLLNRGAFAQPMPVSKEVFELLAECFRLSSETAGAFDVTAGPLVREWGFKAREGRVPSHEKIAEAMRSVGYQHLELDARKKTIRFKQPGLELNLAAIGKGYALDRLYDHLVGRRAASFLLNAGSSSVRAHGRLEDSGWIVDIGNPRDRRLPVGQIRLVDQALSTSGSSEQHVEFEGRLLSHVIDPRTGWPIEGRRQVTVVSPTASRSEALSTAFFVQGWEWSADYCQRSKEVGVVYFEETRGVFGPPRVAGSVHWIPFRK